MLILKSWTIVLVLLVALAHQAQATIIDYALSSPGSELKFEGVSSGADFVMEAYATYELVIENQTKALKKRNDAVIGKDLGGTFSGLGHRLLSACIGEGFAPPGYLAASRDPHRRFIIMNRKIVQLSPLDVTGLNDAQLSQLNAALRNHEFAIDVVRTQDHKFEVTSHLRSSEGVQTEKHGKGTTFSEAILNTFDLSGTQSLD